MTVPDATQTRNSRADTTRTTALTLLFTGVCAIAAGYASAFARGVATAWGPWLLAFGIPAVTGAIMVLGAARGSSGVGRLKTPFVFVVAVLAVGFLAALALPATESAMSRLWLGLPLRAAIVIYGVGLLPIVILPIAYAITFETQTLRAEDIERVRALARELAAERERATREKAEPSPP